MSTPEDLLDFFDKILSMFFSGNPRIFEAYQDLKEILPHHEIFILYLTFFFWLRYLILDLNAQLWFFDGYSVAFIVVNSFL